MADPPTYPTVEEFEHFLTSQPPDAAVDQYLFTGTPFVFRDSPDELSVLREHLSTRLDCDAEAIHVVGSGKLGFALSPDSYPRAFSDESDVDVVIVSETLFDQYWITFLEWNYPRRHRLPAPEYRWSRARQEDLWWGWFQPTRIRFEGLLFPEVLAPVRDFSFSWFDAFRSLSLIRSFAGRDFNGRLYRTQEHARLYHLDGFRKLRAIVESEGS